MNLIIKFGFVVIPLWILLWNYLENLILMNSSQSSQSHSSSFVNCPLVNPHGNRELKYIFVYNVECNVCKSCIKHNIEIYIFSLIFWGEIKISFMVMCLVHGWSSSSSFDIIIIA